MTRPEPPSRPPPPSRIPGQRVVPGAEWIASAFLLRDALARLDDQTRAAVTKNLADVLPRGSPAGTVVGDRVFRPDELRSLIPSAAVAAAGLDPKRVSMPPPPVLWESGGDQLLLRLAGVQAQLGLGLIELTIPVSCDQTGDTAVTVTFLTGTPDRPAGGVSTTEDHPRGPEVIVENWHEPLIAFAWQTILIATGAIAGAVGADFSGQPLITQALAVTTDGLRVSPMAQHTFAQASRLR